MALVSYIGRRNEVGLGLVSALDQKGWYLHHDNVGPFAHDLNLELSVFRRHRSDLRQKLEEVEFALGLDVTFFYAKPLRRKVFFI